MKEYTLTGQRLLNEWREECARMGFVPARDMPAHLYANLAEKIDAKMLNLVERVHDLEAELASLTAPPLRPKGRA